MIGAKVTGMFFDRAEVIAAVGKARVKILSRAGALVRRSAKSLLVFKPLVRKPRRVKNRQLNIQRMRSYYAAKKASASRPGQVPFVRRKGYPNLSSIVYAYDPATSGVVIGPIERRNRSMERPGPDVAERGGSVTINVKTIRGKRPMRATYAARPIMGPAFAATASKIPAVMSNVIGPSG